MAKKKYSAKEMSDFRAKRAKEEEKEHNMLCLMRNALDRFDSDKLIELFADACYEKRMHHDLVNALRETLAREGYAVIKIDNISDEFELKKFCTTLVSNSNEFQTRCLFN